MKRKILLFISILIAISFLAACSKDTGREENKLTVAVSIVPQATFISEIAGDLVDVITMIPPGSSAETYSPSPKQLRSFTSASIYFSIGVPAELASIMPAAVDLNRELKIIDLAKAVRDVYPDIEISPGERDPHIWLSPKRVMVMIDKMTEELSSLDPENRDTYLKNAEKYQLELAEVDSEIKKSLESLGNKTFIAYHPAFGYFAEDYGLKMLSLEEEGKEATPQTFKNIVDIAKKNDIKVIFYQAEVDSRQSEAFANEIGGRAEKIAPLAADYIENLRKMAETFWDVLK